MSVCLSLSACVCLLVSLCLGLYVCLWFLVYNSPGCPGEHVCIQLLVGGISFAFELCVTIFFKRIVKLPPIFFTDLTLISDPEKEIFTIFYSEHFPKKSICGYPISIYFRCAGNKALFFFGLMVKRCFNGFFNGVHILKVILKEYIQILTRWNGPV